MTVFVPFGWVTSQITAFGNIYSNLTGIDYTLLCVLFAVFALAFVMPSGLKTVAWTDFIFSCFMIAMCIVCVVFVTVMGGGHLQYRQQPQHDRPVHAQLLELHHR